VPVRVASELCVRDRVSVCCSLSVIVWLPEGFDWLSASDMEGVEVSDVEDC
jgi:hypothetical protein